MLLGFSTRVAANIRPLRTVVREKGVWPLSLQCSAPCFRLLSRPLLASRAAGTVCDVHLFAVVGLAWRSAVSTLVVDSAAADTG